MLYDNELLLIKRDPCENVYCTSRCLLLYIGSNVIVQMYLHQMLDAVHKVVYYTSTVL